MRPRFLSPRRSDAAEASANVLVGLAINWSILAVVYGQPLTATWISLAMIGVSWARSYAIRRFFRGVGNG